MSAPAVHTVRITDELRIEFTCNAGPDADCRNYPDCECESWDYDHEHRPVPQAECWMTPWFENDCTSPMSDSLSDCGYTAGMSGPIETTFCHDYVEWEFVQ